MEKVIAWFILLFAVVGASSYSAGVFRANYDEEMQRVHIVKRSDSGDRSLGYVIIKEEGVPEACEESESDVICLQYPNSKVTVTPRDGTCVTVSASSNSSTVVTHCQDHLGAHVYMGLEQSNQYWPMENITYTEYSYITKWPEDVGIAERYWLFSDGRYLHVPPTVPLFMSQNTADSVDQLCLISQNAAPYPLEREGSFFEYTSCAFDDVREAHEDALTRFLGRPTGIPDERMTTYPIWSTWARFKEGVTDSLVRQFAAEILDNGFTNSQLEIDGLWESCLGSLTFTTDKFPDTSALVADLHALGFRVTLWIHPFINLDCQPYHDDALANGYFVTNTDGNTTTSWWNGYGGIIDFTNTEAAAWWAGRLQALQEDYGFDSFKFDAGETSWLPQLPDISPIELNPVQYSVDYVQTAVQFGSAIEVRTGERTQSLPVYMRMIDKDTRWTLENGLPTLVTTLLMMNLAGYPFALPDMVGGNGYGSDTITKELMVRWLQANVFMPSIQYSYAPWDFDEEAVEICRRYTELHANYSEQIIAAMQRTVEDGSPINPPIWWISPNDSVALGINSEFLLGEDILVAPVMEEGATSRDIYLPAGQWRDEVDPDQAVIEGPTWLLDYPAPLDTLPYFTRIAAG